MFWVKRIIFGLSGGFIGFGVVEFFERGLWGQGIFLIAALILLIFYRVALEIHEDDLQDDEESN
jgi:hypothetical protein